MAPSMFDDIFNELYNSIDEQNIILQNLISMYFFYLQKKKMSWKMKRILKDLIRQLKYSNNEIPEFFLELQKDVDEIDIYFKLNGIYEKDYILPKSDLKFDDLYQHQTFTGTTNV